MSEPNATPGDCSDGDRPLTPTPDLNQEELLYRARDVARRIVERVRKATGDTDAHAALPADPTETNPPIP